MADNVTIPVAPSTAVIATDEVDLGSGLAQVQYGKLVDGADGGTNRLGVNDDGAIAQARRFGTLFALVSPGQIAYTDGQVVGGFGLKASIPSGFYSLQNALVAGFAGQDLTGLDFHVVGYGNAVGGTPTLPADGDAFTLDISGGSGANVVWDSDDLALSTYFGGSIGGFALKSRGNTAPTALGVLAGVTAPEPGVLVDLSLSLIAHGPIATDLTAGPLGIILACEFLGTGRIE